MAKFNLFSGVAFIKDALRSSKCVDVKNPDAEQDIELLAAMCAQAMYLYSRNGLYYWYYFLRSKDNVDVAQFLLQRNGIFAEPHKTRYMGARNLVLRVPYRAFSKSPVHHEFLNSVNDTYFAAAIKMDNVALNECIRQIQQKMM